MLALEWPVYEAILEHAREAAPEEACGMLAGRRDGGGRATAIHRTENTAARPEVTYEIDPEEQYRVMATIEADGDDLLGFYHSHPAGPPGPSRTDQRKATWPDHHYLIASLGGELPTLDAWVWTGDRFVMDAVSVVPASDTRE